MDKTLLNSCVEIDLVSNNAPAWYSCHTSFVGLNGTYLSRMVLGIKLGRGSYDARRRPAERAFLNVSDFGLSRGISPLSNALQRIRDAVQH